MNFWKRYLLRPREDENDLLEDIRSTALQLNSVREWFNSESDADMIESCVYHLESLEARYRYLLRLAKERGLQCGEPSAGTDEKRPA